MEWVSFDAWSDSKPVHIRACAWGIKGRGARASTYAKAFAVLCTVLGAQKEATPCRLLHHRLWSGCPLPHVEGASRGGAREREGAMLAHLVLLLALAAVLRLVVLAMRWRWRVIVCANPLSSPLFLLVLVALDRPGAVFAQAEPPPVLLVPSAERLASKGQVVVVDRCRHEPYLWLRHLM